MTDKYNPQEIEPRWQSKWQADGLYRSIVNPSRPKHYALTMLPYPSGDLHIGHMLFELLFKIFRAPVPKQHSLKSDVPQGWSVAVGGRAVRTRRKGRVLGISCGEVVAGIAGAGMLARQARVKKQLFAERDFRFAHRVVFGDGNLPG